MLDNFFILLLCIKNILKQPNISSMLGENYDWKYGHWYNHHSGIYIEEVDAAVWAFD
jgi:hypothetical protein